MAEHEHGTTRWAGATAPALPDRRHSPLDHGEGESVVGDHEALIRSAAGCAASEEQRKLLRWLAEQDCATVAGLVELLSREVVR